MKLTDERITEIAVDGLGMIACKHCTFAELGYGLDKKELIAFARAIAAEQRRIDAEIAKNVGAGTDKLFGDYYLMSSSACANTILKEGEE
jgi:hypothetical protein